MAELTHLCEMCRAKRPLTYRRDRDEYICDDCWDTLTVAASSADDESEDNDE